MDANTLLGDRYALAECIGTGGMSDVYAGTDTLLGRDVAVKMMRPDLARDATFLERFRREALNAAKLNHHSIVAIYDTGQTSEADGSVPYIVMERVRGRTLRDIVREDGRVSPEYAASVMADVAEALQFSHEAGIIHRDIKPANIMITATGAVKVMDFGIARALGEATSSMTQTAAVIGTAQYLSPEQARGRSADARSDIYASGCVFYELVTGRPPFQGESPFSVAYQHVQDDPIPPSQVPGMDLGQPMGTNVDAVVLTAMAKDPQDRYEKATDFAADLRRIAEHRVPLAAQAHVADPATTVFPAEGAHSAAAGGAAGAAAGYAASHMDRPDSQQGANAYAPTSQFAQANPGADSAQTGSQPAQFTNQGRGSSNTPPRQSAQISQREPEKSSSVGTWSKIIWSLVLLTLLGVGGYIAWSYYQSTSSTSASSSQITIPDVKGLSQADATARIKSQGLEVSTVEQSSADVAKGMVIDTNPTVGSQVPKGSTVTLTVSSGKEVTDVPDLTGKDTAEASQLLQEAGLTLDQTVKEASSDTVSSGKIMEQSPGAGSQVSKGTKVTITVSTGVENVRVPVVTGQNISDARGNLEGAGFQVHVTQVDSTRPSGEVLSVSNEGQNLPKGSTIEVRVSKGNQIQMPTITGQTADQALATLQNAGWSGGTSKFTKHNQNTSDLNQVNKVMTQSIPAGQTIDKSASIDVGVGVFSLLP